jgi:hypothetical protein
MPTLQEAYARFGGGGVEETFQVHGLAEPAPGVPVGRVIVWRSKNGNPPDPGSAIGWTADDRTEAQNRIGGVPLTFTGGETAAVSDYLDTNLNGSVDGADTPTIMPVTVRIRWRSHSSVVTEYFSTVIGIR